MVNIPEFFGLDLGDHSIKYVQLKSEGEDKAKILNLSSTLTSIGVLYNESEKGIETLAKELQSGYSKSGIKTKNCVMSLPEMSAFSRLLNLPRTPKVDETSEAILWALKPLIPVSIEDVNISYLEIDSVKTGGIEMVNWYVVAAPKKMVERYQQVATKAGFNLLAVETEALAITRAVQFNHRFDQENVMIVDFGAESTNIILARNGIVLFSQTISTGSNALTKVIASDYGIDVTQAEKYKVSFGLDTSQGDGKIAKSIEPVVQIIISELSRTLVYFKDKIGGSAVSKIYLGGGGSGLPGLGAYIKNKTGIETMVVNPLLKIQPSSSIKDKLGSENINSYLVALGLGIKGVL